MDIRNKTLDRNASSGDASILFKPEDKLAMGNMKYAQGLGASIRYANELRAVQQTGRLAPFLKSSRLHEDVLRGNLGPGTGFKDMFEREEDR